MQMRTILFLWVIATVITGCSYYANKPLETPFYMDTTSGPHENLFIFMRGLGGSHHSFAQEGMVDEVRKRNIPFDMMAPNAHFGYYSERTLVKRLQEDVILPAIQQGYTHIWLVGISMGGLGSMLFLKEQPENIKGICLISPFLGYDDILDEINSKVSLQKWTPGQYDPEDDWGRMFWHWIKDEVAENRSVPIYLGYGTEDRYKKGQDLLAANLSENEVYRTTGGHDYATFKKIWVDFLDRNFYNASKESSQNKITGP